MKLSSFGPLNCSRPLPTHLGPEAFLFFPVVVVVLVLPRRRRGGDRRGRLFALPVAILGLFLRFLLLPK